MIGALSLPVGAAKTSNRLSNRASRPALIPKAWGARLSFPLAGYFLCCQASAPVITDAVDEHSQQFAAMWLSRRIVGGLKLAVCRNKRLGRLDACDHVKLRRFRFTKDCLCACHFFRRTVRHYEKPVSLYGGLVLDHAVLRHADAIQGRAKRAQPTDDDRVLDAGDHNGREISEHDDVSDEGNGHEQAAKEQSPKSAPER